ncbi:MAG: mechanosensitive ion channel family protein [Myxococcota bacterium]
MEETIDKGINTLVELLSTWGVSVLGALALLIVGLWVAKRVRNMTAKSMTRAKVDESLIPFVSGITYYLALAVVLIAVLNLFGIETTSLIAVLGAAGLAVGLALQGTLSNFSAGVMLLIFRPFKKGDFVDAGGTKGTVVEIGVFSTSLKTPDNVGIIVPNSAIFGSTISNYNAYETRRNDMVVGIGYGDDIDKAFEIIRSVLAGDDRVLADPEPAVFVANLGDSSVDIAVRPWCRAEDYWGLRGDLTKQFKEAIEAGGCSIPFPQRDIHVFNNGAAAPN